jgi:glycosyltransferase involved in cell wall biosynthesis
VIRELGLEGVAEAPGVVSTERVADSLTSALCLVLPSRREGYGLVVVEAAARGTPSVVVSGPDNAASELIEDGINGVLVDRDDTNALSAGILRVVEAGGSLRASTFEWFHRNREELSVDSSLAVVLDAYSEASR